MATLLDGARSGDRGSVDAIVRELTPLLWHVARSQGLDRESSADVVQTTWFRLFGSLHGIHTPQALTTWLVTVTKREAWKTARTYREQPTDSDLFADLTDPMPTPEDRVVAASANRELWTTLKRLPERCQRLLRVVAFVHRPDYREVGAALGMPVGAIGPTRGRCLAKLRTLLIENATEPGGDPDGRV
jgi:RNA polymerase sigma factor (sigma-70 family)